MSVSESKSFLVTIINGVYLGKDTSIWPGFQGSYFLNLQLILCKKLTLSSASFFVTKDLFIYIYFLLFEENYQNQTFKAGKKFLQLQFHSLVLGQKAPRQKPAGQKPTDKIPPDKNPLE